MVRYKINDTAPPLIVQLQCEAGFDLTGGQTVAFNLYKPDGTIVSRASTIVDAATNIVRHDFQSGDMDQAGRYEGEFVVTSGGLGSPSVCVPREQGPSGRARPVASSRL